MQLTSKPARKVQSSKPSVSLPGRGLAAIGLNLCIILVVLAAAAIVPTSGRALVIVPPWSDPARVTQVIRDAGGSYVNGTGAAYAAIAQSDTSGFALKLFRSGALLVLDGRLASFCRSTPAQ